MNRIWKKISQEEIKQRVFSALDRNINYHSRSVLGIPASYLDDKVFNQDASFVKDAPFISTLIHNPNHIGCHTLGKSESFFQGTQEIEKELIEICAVDILKAEPQSTDGYVASGGTEANIQAIWVYRNLFMNEMDARRDEIAIICSSDSHYSMAKGANLLAIDVLKIEVDENTRLTPSDSIRQTVKEAREKGKKYFICICNMMTTMFGSVDDVEVFSSALEELEVEYRIHVDGAYGGFYFPFSNEDSHLTFANPTISSFTLDAHKMAQAPYGTGIFLIRKNLIHHANTQEASYVEGQDFTLIGSRSGANAIAVWMILSTYGPYGWFEKVFVLQKRTDWMCDQLREMGIDFYRHPHSNIITMRSRFVDREVAARFGLVPDDHTDPRWFKIVIMEHVTIEKLKLLVESMKAVLPKV